MQRNEAAAKEVRQHFRFLNRLFWAFEVFMLLFLFWSWVYTAAGEKPLNPELTGMLRYLAPISGLALILLARRLFLGRVRDLKPADAMWKKLDAYRSGSTLRLLLLDGAGFVNIVSFMLTGEYFFIALSLLIILILFLFRPSIPNMVREMNLTEVEEKVLRDHRQ